MAERASEKSSPAQRKLVSRRGFWPWKRDGKTVAAPRGATGAGQASDLVVRWERDNRGPVVGLFAPLLGSLRPNILKLAVPVVTFLLGALLASGPDSAAANLRLRERLQRLEVRLKARQGELGLVRMEISRLNSIIEHSRHYRIPADLATAIYDISLSEGIDPKIGFALVSVESNFLRTAVSNKGAIGLTQMMPETARLLDPRIKDQDLFNRETNLRLGFRFLREMLSYYNGDLGLALTAYNRGPTRVDEIRKSGGNPSNGYARSVIGESR